LKDRTLPFVLLCNQLRKRAYQCFGTQVIYFAKNGRFLFDMFLEILFNALHIVEDDLFRRGFIGYCGKELSADYEKVAQTSVEWNVE
jgi:hypothetical protein